MALELRARQVILGPRLRSRGFQAFCKALGLIDMIGSFSLLQCFRA